MVRLLRRALALLIYLNLRPHWHDLAAAATPRCGWRRAISAHGRRRRAARCSRRCSASSTAWRKSWKRRWRRGSAGARHRPRSCARRWHGCASGLTMMDEAESDDERRGYRDGMERDMQELDG
jgi:two-component system sensor histidine kinase RstB